MHLSPLQLFLFHFVTYFLHTLFLSSTAERVLSVAACRDSTQNRSRVGECLCQFIFPCMFSQQGDRILDPSHFLQICHHQCFLTFHVFFCFNSRPSRRTTRWICWKDGMLTLRALCWRNSTSDWSLWNTNLSCCSGECFFVYLFVFFVLFLCGLWILMWSRG